ncbi:MAG: MarR family transcriptional regulator, partial [Microbacterium sp.]|nr:MarR family transcriptional regulator [Microbacterium sp.]
MTNAPRSLTSTQLEAYLAFTEVGSLLRPAVEAQLKDAGGLSYVQFQLLARLNDAPGGTLRMTDLADGVVYSRSGLTYQATLLEQRGYVTRSPSPEDERSTVVALTGAGRDVLA